MSLASAHRTNSHYSIYLKIFLNYLQLVTVTSTFELAWPSYILEVFKVQASAGNVSEQVFSLDCFLDNGHSDNQQQVVYLKLLVVTSVPLGIVLFSACFWGLLSLIKRNLKYLKYELVNSIVVLFFIAHPSIVRVTFDVFNCKEIQLGEFWLTSYLNIRCWDHLHSRFAMGIALPGVILWGAFTPAAALVALIAMRKRLDELNSRIRFGFLYNGYQISYYYWEFVILYRKMVIIVLAVFFTNISIPVQSLCVLMVLIVSFIMQLKSGPFKVPVLNSLELRGILVATVTIYCGLFYLTQGLDSTTQIVLFLVVIAANAYFLLYWLVKSCAAACEVLSKCWKQTMMRINRSPAVQVDVSSKSRSLSVGDNASKVIPQIV
jgi:hypothetical protein